MFTAMYATDDPNVAGEYIDVEEAGDGVWKAVIPDHNACEFKNQYLVQVNDSLLLRDISVLSYANSMLSDAEMVPFASAIIELCTAAHCIH